MPFKCRIARLFKILYISISHTISLAYIQSSFPSSCTLFTRHILNRVTRYHHVRPVPRGKIMKGRKKVSHKLISHKNDSSRFTKWIYLRKTPSIIWFNYKSFSKCITRRIWSWFYHGAQKYVIMFHRSSILARMWIGGSIVRSIMRIEESSCHPVTISRSSPLLSSPSFIDDLPPTLTLQTVLSQSIKWKRKRISKEKKSK